MVWRMATTLEAPRLDSLSQVSVRQVSVGERGRRPRSARSVSKWIYSSSLVVLLALPGCAAEQPNVILAMADDQGWGDTAYNGHSVLKTPTLDEMAASGLRFDRSYAAAPVCSPSRCSVLTGRHPNRFGCFTWGHDLRAEEVTIAEALREAGYRTGHFGKWHVGPVRTESPVSPGSSGFDAWLSSPNFYDLDPWMSDNGEAVKTQGEGSMVIVDAAVKFIHSAAQAKQPFLAVIWFGSPHVPHEALDEDLAQYRDQAEQMKPFLGEITAMDRAMGHLRQQLRALGVADNTLLWYTSDNGAIPVGSTGGLKGKKGDLWEGGIRVPGIIEWPSRITTHRTTDIPVSTVDIYPTVLDIAGVEAPRARLLDGISLAPLIDGEMAQRSKPLGFWVYPAQGRPVRSSELLQELAEEQRTGQPVRPDARLPLETRTPAKGDSADRLPGHAAWIDGDYKLHRIPDGEGFKSTLFNLKIDPAETHDLVEQETSRAKAMRAQLEAWQHSVTRSLNGEDY
ncbi:MAG: sulfatase-like hydrolase/transferase [Luteitalea sp.]|nr:sulfatase-like hydrolase/transferase [Luteitalea sp.]